jgi:hypothetical protein
MKRLLAAVAFLSALTLVVAGTGQAAVTVNTTIPSSFTFSDECTGELVSVSGDIHLVITSTVTDTSISGTTHSEFKATGVGLSSGLPYQLVVVANFAFHSSLQDGEFTVTQEGKINVVAPGGATISGARSSFT